MVRTIRMKKISKPYTQVYFLHPNQPFVAVRGRRYLPTGIRTAAVPYENTLASLHNYACRMGHTLRIHLPYLYVSAVHSCPSKLYNVHVVTHDRSSRTIRTRAIIPYWTNGDFSIRIHYELLRFNAYLSELRYAP